MKRRRITEKSDPSDGFWADDPAIYEGLIEKDAYGDYDGDGVPNAVELFIGKDPVVRDVLGVHLNVSIEWNASEDEIKAFIKSFQRASQVVYDYTDGHTMITKITIYTNVKRYSHVWNESDVIIHRGDSSYFNATTLGWWIKWSSNAPTKDRALSHINLFEKFGGNSPLDRDYYYGIAHEMAHYLYWILDEYCTWEGLHYGIISSDLKQYGIEFKPLPTIMSYEDDVTKAKGIKWSELSTPRDYKWFNAQLKDLDMYFEELYKKNWTYFTTDHWHTYQKSAWEILVDMISKPRFFSIVSLEETVYIVTVDANINFDLDTDITQYEPKVGPYTGVGYYLEVNT